MSVTPLQSLNYSLQELTIGQLDVLNKKQIKALIKEKTNSIQTLCGKKITEAIGADLIDSIPIALGKAPSKPSDMAHRSVVKGKDSEGFFIAIKVHITREHKTATAVEVIRRNNKTISFKQSVTDDQGNEHSSFFSNFSSTTVLAEMKKLLEGDIIESEYDESYIEQKVRNWSETYSRIDTMLEKIRGAKDNSEVLRAFSITDLELLSEANLASIKKKKIQDVTKSWGTWLTNRLGAKAIDSVPSAGYFSIPVDLHSKKFKCRPSDLGKNSAVKGMDRFNRQYLALRLHIFKTEKAPYSTLSTVVILYKETLGKENTDLEPYSFAETMLGNQGESFPSFFYNEEDPFLNQESAQVITSLLLTNKTVKLPNRNLWAARG